MTRQMIAGKPRIPLVKVLIPLWPLFLGWGLPGEAAAQTAEDRIQRLKITILSTMLVGDTTGIGEWGFDLPRFSQPFIAGVSRFRFVGEYISVSS